MLIAVGTRVTFRFTGETGRVTELLENGMVRVRLDSDPSIEVPVFEDDLMRDTDREPASPGAKFVQAGSKNAPPPPPRREIKSQYIILKSMGIQLCFEPMPGADGMVSKYKVWLVNDTQDDVFVDFKMWVLDDLVLQLNEKLANLSALDVGNILVDYLNDVPEVEFRCQRFTTAGLDAPVDKSLKIKSKQFFNRLLTAPILNCQVYHYILIENPRTAAAPADSPTRQLKEYTQQKVQEKRTQRSMFDDLFAPVKLFNVEEFANFDNEIDLHIEKLTNGFARMDRGMALRLQLQHFERFIDKAIQLGVPRVFIIHGVGEGKLKAAIGERLRQMPEVKKFKNEYHHKYGYGATEVIFEN